MTPQAGGGFHVPGSRLMMPLFRSVLALSGGCCGRSATHTMDAELSAMACAIGGMAQGTCNEYRRSRNRPEMNAAFFGLACLAALNPKLLVVDLILAANKRPRLMFVCFLLGGMGLGLTVGLLDVLVLHVDALKTQNHASGGLDLALGIPLLAVGALLATDHVHIRRLRRHHPPKGKRPSKLAVWAQQVLHEPRYGLAVLIGAAVGTPGASYLLALHKLISSKTPTTVAVIAVIVFVIINWVLVLVPFAFLMARPQGAEDALKRFEHWLTSHEPQIIAGVCLLAGAYMVITGLVRVLS
jgi:hypothetical protein